MIEPIFKPFLRSFFYGQFGITLFDIPKSDIKTPDFEIREPHDPSLIELKIKQDDPAEVKADGELLKQGLIVSKTKSLGKRNGLSAIIEDGCDQLSTHDPSHEKLHFLWLHCTGIDAPRHFEQFRSTLLGAQKLFDKELEMTECFYFHSCDFYRFREVFDGAFVSQIEGDQFNVTFFVNSLSPHIEKLRVSKLYQAFNKAVVDPDILESEKTGLIADGSCPRESEAAILEYLRSKYGLSHLQTITFAQHSAAIAIPDKLRGSP